MRFGFIISLIFAILVALFGIQNAAVISVNFCSTKLNISLALVIFVSAIIGAVISTILGLQKEFSLSRGNRRLTKDADNFQARLETCKNDNVSLKIENETFKIKSEALESKTEDLESKIDTLETNNKNKIDEINVLNIEIARLNIISSSETNV